MNDVCLVLEGTYPRTVGGVSRWVQELTGALPELRFSVARLAHEGDPAGPWRYRPGLNVEVREVALDPDDPARTSGELPPARIYHALSTGFAGAVAARTAARRGSPLVVTEHGLAWREAAFPFVTGSHHHYWPQPAPDARAAWIEHHRGLAREAYAAAAAVTTVCAENAAAQRALGALAPRTIENAASLRSGRVPDGALRVGLIGRVTPVKDVASFVRACALVAERVPRAEFAVVGPLDQDRGYAERCLALAARLGLGDRLVFAGEADTDAWLRRLDVVALTSVSEAQPLALLEAMGAGIPVVATDVGGCRSLVRGAGLVVPPGSPRAAADAIARLLLDSELRARLGAAGRRRVALRHRPERLARAYRALYEEVAA
ncbi:MAG TPA: GT4 family glycosyltransferase PelF [Gaiellaceae bacterium]|nr:GT4 family glycosyltransferase PelF [Gaiellaceae bacterium]